MVACKSKKETMAPAVSVAESKPAPIWVSSRPNNGFKYVGIGFCDKAKTSNFQMEAKKNALYDLASEIKVDINSNSVLYTVQNNNNFNESFNSMIKLSNSDNIEGYQLIDSYENDKQYWVYYSLDKDEYAKRKAEKKQLIINKASNLITSSFSDEFNNNFTSALKKRIQAFGVLTPYLSEEINFDPSHTNGLRTIFDLTSLVQQQLQSITVIQPQVIPTLLPYQKSYLPLTYSLQIKGKTALQNFPFVIESTEDKIKLVENSASNTTGELQIKPTIIEPLDQMVTFNLNPDVNSLMSNDSIGKASLQILKQFVSTSSLKVNAIVRPIKIYLTSIENNFGKQSGLTILNTLIEQKFNGGDIRIVTKQEESDFIVECLADTKEDVSSEVLEKNYQTKLANLIINLQLKSTKDLSVLYKNQVADVYGYANSIEKAGLNAYESPKLKSKLDEALFFLKRKILVY